MVLVLLNVGFPHQAWDGSPTRTEFTMVLKVRRKPNQNIVKFKSLGKVHIPVVLQNTLESLKLQMLIYLHPFSVEISI